METQGFSSARGYKLIRNVYSAQRQDVATTHRVRGLRTSLRSAGIYVVLQLYERMFMNVCGFENLTVRVLNSKTSLGESIEIISPVLPFCSSFGLEKMLRIQG